MSVGTTFFHGSNHHQPINTYGLCLTSYSNTCIENPIHKLAIQFHNELCGQSNYYLRTLNAHYNIYGNYNYFRNMHNLVDKQYIIYARYAQECALEIYARFIISQYRNKLQCSYINNVNAILHDMAILLHTDNQIQQFVIIDIDDMMESSEECKHRILNIVITDQY
jgi:DNA-binding ferritin-like protein